LDDQWVIEEIRGKAKSSWNLMKMTTQLPEHMGHSKDRTKGKIYSYECLQFKNKIERYQINSLMMHLKLLEKQEQSKP
jgi:hypothetical protein